MSPLFTALRRPAPYPGYGRSTLQDAHGRLDMLEEQVGAMSSAIEKAAVGQSEMAKSITELTGAVGTLRTVTASTQESLKTFLTNSEAGREILAKMIGDVIDKKTGGWLRFAVLGLLAGMGSWLPKAIEIFKSGYHG